MNYRNQVLLSLVALACLSSCASAAYSTKLLTWPEDVMSQNIFRHDNYFMFEAQMRTNYTAGPGPNAGTIEKSFDKYTHYELFALTFEAFAQMKWSFTFFNFWSFSIEPRMNVVKVVPYG